MFELEQKSHLISGWQYSWVSYENENLQAAIYAQVHLSHYAKKLTTSNGGDDDALDTNNISTDATGQYQYDFTPSSYTHYRQSILSWICSLHQNNDSGIDSELNGAKNNTVLRKDSVLQTLRSRSNFTVYHIQESYLICMQRIFFLSWSKALASAGSWQAGCEKWYNTHSDSRVGKTLVIAPSSCLVQWTMEIERYFHPVSNHLLILIVETWSFNLIVIWIWRL